MNYTEKLNVQNIEEWQKEPEIVKVKMDNDVFHIWANITYKSIVHEVRIDYDKERSSTDILVKPLRPVSPMIRFYCVELLNHMNTENNNIKIAIHSDDRIYLTSSVVFSKKEIENGEIIEGVQKLTSTLLDFSIKIHSTIEEVPDPGDTARDILGIDDSLRILAAIL